MKRLIAHATVLGMLSCAALVGCGEEAKVEKTTTIEGPGGTSEIKETKSVESEGSNPPIKVEEPANK